MNTFKSQATTIHAGRLTAERVEAPTHIPMPVPRERFLSIVVPFFNEGNGVEVFHEHLAPVIAVLRGYRVEVVCVDDGSGDDTLERLLALARRYPVYRVVELSRNFGKEAALTAGLDEARGAAVVTMDADLQDPPSLLVRMLQQWNAGAEVVLARRADRSSDGLLKRITAEWFYRVHNMVADIRIPQNVGDFRLMDRAVVNALKSLPERQRFMKGLFCWVGFKTVAIDFERAPRAVGSSKFPWWKLWNLAIEGVTSFSTAPLRIWTYVGVLGALLTSLYGAAILMRTLLWGIQVPGYASVFIAILFFGSLNLISMGLLGEYIGRIYVESKQRPIYLVRSKFAQEATTAAGPRIPRRACRSYTATVRRPSKPVPATGLPKESSRATR
jgi:glycosyltransferase involved in cell wall biosynthesis